MDDSIRNSPEKPQEARKHPHRTFQHHYTNFQDIYKTKIVGDAKAKKDEREMLFAKMCPNAHSDLIVYAKCMDEKKRTSTPRRQRQR